jgi:hypothetical protein
VEDRARPGTPEIADRDDYRAPTDAVRNRGEMPEMLCDKTEAIGFAAAPTFAIMAMVTWLHDGGMPAILCSAAQGGAALGGMLPMYLLMVAFHSPPWLKLFFHWRNRTASKAVECSGRAAGKTLGHPVI